MVVAVIIVVFITENGRVTAIAMSIPPVELVAAGRTATAVKSWDTITLPSLAPRALASLEPLQP